MNPETSVIIEKWYKKLHFNSKYDTQFYEALHTIPIPADTNISDYDFDCTDGKKNLLAYLYMCEALQTRYVENGISEKILLDTLSDIVRWCDTWSDIKGELYLGEIGWLACHMRFQLFMIGRLQYCIEPVSEKLTKFGMTLGEHYLGVHIPATGPLRIEDCEQSLAMARGFFEEYFPHMQYSWFSCNSWLLDDTLQEILPKNSNILKFAAIFRVVEKKQADDIIRFVFGWDATRDNMDMWNCRSGFAKTVKDCIANGKVFYESRGLIAK